MVTKFTANFLVGSSAFCSMGVCSFRTILVIRSHYLLIQYQATIRNTAYDNQKQIQNVEQSKYLGTLITDDARRICHWIQDCRFKHGIQQEEDPFHQQTGLKCKEGVGKMLFSRGVADKSFARLGRKQATVTKLGIYWTYSPRSSIQFLPLALTFDATQKKIRILSI